MKCLLTQALDGSKTATFHLHSCLLFRFQYSLLTTTLRRYLPLCLQRHQQNLLDSHHSCCSNYRVTEKNDPVGLVKHNPQLLLQKPHLPLFNVHLTILYEAEVQPLRNDLQLSFSSLRVHSLVYRSIHFCLSLRQQQYFA